MNCPRCSSENIKKNGIKNDLQQYKCKECNRHFLNTTSATTKAETEYSYNANNNTAHMSGFSNKRITSKDELFEFFKVDEKEWSVESWKCGVYESHTKLRKYKNGKRLNDEHKIVPLYKVSATFKFNRQSKNLHDLKAEIIEELKQLSPKRAKIKYRKINEGVLFEINPFDLHFGKHTWEAETGQNYDIKIAKRKFEEALQKLIDQTQFYNIKKILFVVGNDFFNVDNNINTTTAGTIQQEDTRWKKTFQKGRELIINAIEKLKQIAPIDILVIPGNHDEQRAFYLGDSLECFYHKDQNVNVNNSAKVRKYYRFGQNLIGFTHGKDEKVKELPLIMANEASKDFAETKYREWHLGDKHHKKEYQTLRTDEIQGVTTRLMRSLSATDLWHYKKGFISNVQAMEGFIWHEKNGLISIVSANL